MHRAGHALGAIARPYSPQSAVRSRRQQMTAQAKEDERGVDVVADFPADTQAAEPVQQHDRSFHDPAVHAQAGAVPGAAPGEVRGDLEPADLDPADLMVIAAVGTDTWAVQWLAALASARRDGLDQRDQLGDAVAVAVGGDCRERALCASTIRWYFGLGEHRYSGYR
ncbi:hypothetical protein V1J52_24375 [Streptomyces sp. TRM 70351]|uniref:hypothetical protein n=1 Tax=Streptomyces sp. TRM 70351 TaxID=3116552 RepID=UPI002E7C0B4F|nr:hypothetical protein [Streptomyces sp. TRM 70351]MEE1931273.1 hypothetical protein [Streptomyces sp. TRM 70351]